MCAVGGTRWGLWGTDPGWQWGGPGEILQEEVTMMLICKGKNPPSTLRAACWNVQTLKADVFQRGGKEEAITLGASI